jgi:hypothetical protein
LKNLNQPEFIFESEGDKKIRRLRLAQDLFDWISSQPEARVSFAAFAEKIGNQSDLDSVIAQSHFGLDDVSEPRWVSNKPHRPASKSEANRQDEERKAARKLMLAGIDKVLLDRNARLLTLEEFNALSGANEDDLKTFLIFHEFYKSTDKDGITWLRRGDHPMSPAKRKLEQKEARRKATRELQEKQKQENQKRISVIREICSWLDAQPLHKVLYEDFQHKISSYPHQDAILAHDTFIRIDYEGKKWIQVRSFYNEFFHTQVEDNKHHQAEDAWDACVLLCGDVSRSDGNKAKGSRLYVIARTFTEESAARQLAVPAYAIHEAAESGDLTSFIDPDGKRRIPAGVVKNILGSSKAMEQISGYILIKPRQIALAAGLSYATVQSRLQRAELSLTEPLWRDVKGKWGLPAEYSAYRAMLDVRYPEWQKRQEERENDEQAMAKGHYARLSPRRRQEVNQLRQQLVAIFPTWDHLNRSEQHITIHLGPTNSGKTFNGLNGLIVAGSGWYLAPLRLLAHEVYDTLNRKGVLCNLLTGEEVIDVPGAKITAATIEMFNPKESGRCVIIDEAHMLADTQRGWAWTRSIMENEAQEIHIIGSPISENLIKRMAEELGFDVTVENYERLTPLNIAGRTWTLEKLPERTILVAFSRRVVLGLKSELEKKYHRTVSVVYGNLPPEARLRQAERFTLGETEICIATDAIGMGLNLPADNVVFFETSKFDGKEVRTLNPNELKQIAGRAGRFGLSEQGWVGALTKNDLKAVREALESDHIDIEYAYVAPTPESIALLPGALMDKLRTWVDLRGIPERWKTILKPVDLTQQIDLASRLTIKDVQKLGEADALTLINAPCAKNTESYWMACAKAIIIGDEMPLPDFDLPKQIHNAGALESFELAIRCADIYLWLGQRREFLKFAPDTKAVRAARYRWIDAVDQALVQKIDTTRRCSQCGRELTVNHPYNLCNGCFRDRRRYNGSFDGDG